MSTVNRLSTLAVAKMKAGKYFDGAGLYLKKKSEGAGKWIFIFTLHGRKCERGLGSYPVVSLKAASEDAEKWRSLVRQNIDPIDERERQKREAARNLHLLEDIAKFAYESRKAELKGDGENERWYSPLELHVLPKLGKVPVAEIHHNDIRTPFLRYGIPRRRQRKRLSVVLKSV